MNQTIKYGIVGGCLCLLTLNGAAQQTEKAGVKSFVEFGTTVHAGDCTPLWQVSNLQGLGSLENSAYLRSGLTYRDRWGQWTWKADWTWWGQKGHPRGCSRPTGTSGTNGWASWWGRRR